MQGRRRKRRRLIPTLYGQGTVQFQGDFPRETEPTTAAPRTSSSLQLRDESQGCDSAFDEGWLET